MYFAYNFLVSAAFCIYFSHIVDKFIVICIIFSSLCCVLYKIIVLCIHILVLTGHGNLVITTCVISFNVHESPVNLYPNCIPFTSLTLATSYQRPKGGINDLETIVITINLYLCSTLANLSQANLGVGNIILFWTHKYKCNQTINKLMRWLSFLLLTPFYPIAVEFLPIRAVY